MILFVTSKYPRKVAASLNNSRVISCLKTCVQMLSNDMHRRGLKGPLKIRRQKHYLCKWLAKDPLNYWWVFFLYSRLTNEYCLRTGNLHSSTKLFETMYHGAPCKYPPTPAFFSEVQFLNPGNESVTIPVYRVWRQYLSAKWDKAKKKPRWTHRQPPKWYDSKRKDM